MKPKRAAEIELDVERRARVVRQLRLVVLMKAEAVLVEAERPMPGHALRLPVLEPLHVRFAARRLLRIDKELHLHLLELTRAEDEVPRA